MGGVVVPVAAAEGAGQGGRASSTNIDHLPRGARGTQTTPGRGGDRTAEEQGGREEAREFRSGERTRVRKK